MEESTKVDEEPAPPLSVDLDGLRQHVVALEILALGLQLATGY